MANSAPVLDNSGTVTLGAIAFEIPAASNSGVSLSELVGNLITDADGDPTAIAITSADSTNGTWQYSLDGGTSWVNFGTVSDSSSLILGAYTLYSGLLDNKPEDQDWLTLGNINPNSPLAGPFATETLTVGGVRLNSQASNAIYAGYGNKEFEIVSNGPTFDVETQLVNPEFPELDADKGFSVAFSMDLFAESRTNQNRAGFSILVTTKTNTKAIELGFQRLSSSTGKIFAQNDGIAPNPNGGSNAIFTAAESVSFNTAQTADYELKILGNSYTLFANGVQILTGSLRNYTAFEGLTSPFLPGVSVDPYAEPNVVFFGDDTTSAQASTNFYQAALKTDTKVRFQPNAGFSGTASFDFRAWDTTNGKSNGDRLSTLANGGATAFSQAFETATLTVLPSGDTGGGDTGGGDTGGGDTGGGDTGGGDTGGGDTGGGDTGGGDTGGGDTGGGDTGGGDTGGGDTGGGTPLQIEFVGTAGNDTLTGNTANNRILGLGSNDLLVGAAGNDTLVGGAGRDTYDGGEGADVHVFGGATLRAALKTSTVRQPDRILGFGATDLISFDPDNNPATANLPTGVFNAGRIRARNLETAAKLAFADKNLKKRGAQSLRALEATFFTYRGVVHLAYNDANAKFNPRADFLAAMPGMQFDTGDGSRGVLKVNNYFS